MKRRLTDRLAGIHLPRFVRHSFSYASGSLLSQASTVVYNIVVRGILAPAVVGFFDFVTVVLNFALNFDPGISAAAGIQLPALEGAGELEEATLVRSTALFAEVGQGLVMAAAIGIFVLAGGVHGQEATAALVAAVTVVLYCAMDSLSTIHQGHQSFVALSAAMIASAAIGALVLPGGAWLGGLHGLFAGSIVMWISEVAILYVAARRAGITFAPRFSWSRLRSLLGLGFPLRLVDFPQQIIATLDLLLVTALLGVKALAIYSFARLVFLQAATVPTPIGNVFVMRAFRLTGAQVSRSKLARDAREFLLLEYLILLPLVICAAVQVFGLLTVTVLPAYAHSVTVLTILIFAVFFVPQTTIIRNFWMIDRRFRKLAVSNLVGLASHGVCLGVAIGIGGVSLTAIAAGTLAGWAGYYAWIIATVGRELFGMRSAVRLGAHALIGVLLTRVILWIVPSISGHHGDVEAVLETARNLALSLVLLTPLAAYGMWRTGVRRHFRLPAPANQG